MHCSNEKQTSREEKHVNIDVLKAQTGIFFKKDRKTK